MQFKVDRHKTDATTKAFAVFLFKEMQKTIKQQTTKYKEKYLIREQAIINCPIMQWMGSPPKSIDLIEYINNCIELVNEGGNYYIRVKPYEMVKSSFTRVDTLIRILEYGVRGIPAFPMLRNIFSYYKRYQVLVYGHFIIERIKRGIFI